ncbi:uncharacterized protein LOC126882247 [Diabrotica virgifera virgifera]|uniref:Uncharacterized protein n=1 Tax=Diabrotica virgifera virgifera TaxID=50390 RepID=A0ABM5JYL6_DIAVI|nr:uncharacterized protein LOC126882247 [Diabrotica virgifera virgifera]
MENNKEKSKLERRSEAELGKQYERHMFALITLKCLLHSGIENFWIASNLAGLDVYDDIVINITYQDGSKEIFLIQIKTRKSDSSIVAEKFLTTRKEFSLKHYQDGYLNITTNEKIKSLIDYTENSRLFFIHLNNFKVEVAHGKEELEFEKLRIEEFRDFITSVNFELSSGFKFIDKTGKNNEKKMFDEQFLSSFYLYPYQIQLDCIKANIQEILTGSKESTIGNAYIQYFYDYSSSSKLIQKISMLDVKLLLLKSLDAFGAFTPSSNIVFESAKILETFSNFSFSVIYELESERIIWGQIMQELKMCFNLNIKNNKLFDYWENPLPNEVQEFIRGKEQRLQNYENLNVKLLYLFMVATRLAPFYTKTESCQLKTHMLQLLTQLNIYTIIYNTDRCTEINFPKNCTVFKSMMDMPKELFDQNINKFFISLRKKTELPISSLIASSGIGECISTDQFVQFYNKILYMNNEHFNKQEIYINRTLTRSIINENILHNLNIPSCIIFNFPENLQLDKINNRFEFHYQKDGFKVYLITFQHLQTFWITHTSSYSFNIFKENEPFISSKFCILQYEFTSLPEAEYYFTLLKSTINVEHFEKYLETEKISDKYFLDFCRQTQVNIICNNAGMGKSMLLRYLLKKFPPEEYVIYIELSKWVKQINLLRTFEDFVRFLKKNFVKNEPKGIYKMSDYFLDWYIKNNQLVLLIDDLEEIQETAILDIFKTAANLGLRLLIVARPHFKKRYENIFGVFSLEITDFTVKDQYIFFENFFKRHKIKDASNILNDFKGSVSLFETSNIGLCQQTMMLAKIFEDNKEAQVKSTIDLYEQYINTVLYKDTNLERQFVYNTICKLALVNIFTENVVKIAIEWSEFKVHVKMLEKANKRNLLTESLEVSLPVFSHKTYAEFLAAKWLSEHFNMNTRVDVKTMYTKIYTERLVTTRWFLDTILLKNLKYPKHILLPTNGYCTYWSDLIGRNQLHYTMSYGKTFDIHTKTEKPEDTTITRRDNTILLKVSQIEPTKLNQDEPNALFSANNVLGIPIESYDINIYLTFQHFHNRNYSKNKQPVKFFQYFDDSDNHHSSDTSTVHKLLLNESDNVLGKSAMEYAILAGTLINIEKVLSYNIIYMAVDFSNLGNEKYFMLYYSAINGFSTIIKKLLTIDNLKNDVIRIKDYYTKMSLLHLAIKYGQTECVKELISVFPAHMFGEDKEKNTAIHLAAGQADTTILQQILDSSPQMINNKNKNGQNALYCAVQAQNIAAANILIKLEDMEIDCADTKNGNSPFSISVLNRCKKIMTILYRHGANINHSNKKGLSPLHLAVIKKNKKLLKLLINWNADVNTIREYNISPLMDAAKRQVALVKILINNDANIQNIDQNGWTALHHAVKSNNKKVVTLLLKHKVEINITNNEGETALMIACRNNFTKVFKVLADVADIHKINKRKMGVLHLAVTGKSIDIVKYLLERKVDTNAKNADDCTALMLACDKNLVDIVKLLIKNNANIEYFSKAWKCSALDICKKKKHLECYKILNEELVRRNEMSRYNEKSKMGCCTT